MVGAAAVGVDVLGLVIFMVAIVGAMEDCETRCILRPQLAELTRSWQVLGIPRIETSASVARIANYSTSPTRSSLIQS
jgi:hypothetical protein